MTEDELRRVKSTIDRLEFLAPLADERGGTLVRGSTLSEAATHLRALYNDAQKLIDEKEMIRQAWKKWRAGYGPTGDRMDEFERVMKEIL